jgi:hypothetical protein
MTDGTWPHDGLPSAAAPLFILAMDQRDSFQRTLFGVTGTPTPDELARMRPQHKNASLVATAITSGSTSRPTRRRASWARPTPSRLDVEKVSMGQAADFSRMCTAQALPRPMTWVRPTLAPSICRSPASPRRWVATS